MRPMLFALLLVAAPALAGPPGLAPAPPAPPAAPFPPGPPRPPTPPGAEEVVILEFLKEHHPARHAELMALKEVDWRAYTRELMRVAEQFERFRSDPEFAERATRMRELHEQLRREAGRMRDLAEKDRKAARAEMEALVTELFEAKQAERRARLAELRARIEELEAEIEQREAERAKIIEDYVDQLAREPVDL